MMNDDNNRPNDEYKQILAAANKLETIQSNLDSVIDFFIAPIIRLYTKLCNDCLKLLFEREFKLDQFRKAEELVWRRVYHDVYKFQKTKKQPLKKQDERLVESHFMSGIGFYSSLIIRLRIHYKIKDVNNIIVPLNLPIGPLDNLATGHCLNYTRLSGRTTNDLITITEECQHEPAVQQWARNAIYRSLIYMGDLARYMLETSDHDFRLLAFKLYQSASRFQPDFGLPFNQLATLAGNQNHNLDAICCYMRCCLRMKPFEGAEGNMKKVFELNNRYYEELIMCQNVIKASDIMASKNPVQDAEILIRSTIIIFIKLTSSLWQALSNNYNHVVQDRIVQETKLFFETLREAIDVEPIVPLANLDDNVDVKFRPIPGCFKNGDFRPRFITPTIMYEFSSIAIMLIAKCQKEQQQLVANNNLVELTNTLALNVLHYATTKCQKMIITKLQELRMFGSENKIMTKPTSDLSLNDITGNSSVSSQQSQENIWNSSSDVSRRNQSRLRKKRAAINYSDGKHRLSSNNDSDLCRLEETALSTIDALDISSEMSEGDDYQDLINLDSSGDTSDDTGPSNLSRPAIRSTRSQNYELGRPKQALDISSTSLPAPDLLTGDLEFHTATPSLGLSSSLIKKDIRIKKRKISPANVDDRFESTMAYLYYQTFLPTIKVLFDWLLSNVNVIDSNIDSFWTFSAELANTTLLLDEIIKVAQTKDLDCDYDSSASASNQQVFNLVYKHKFNNPDWLQKFPLSCDYPLINLSPLKSVHDINIDFNYPRKLNDSEAGYITAQCVFAFSYALSSFLKNKTC